MVRIGSGFWLSMSGVPALTGRQGTGIERHRIPDDQGGVFQFTFTQAGTYPYHCTPHPQMTGTIVVG